MFGVISDWIGLIGGIVGIASGAASVFSAKSAATSNRIAKDALEENKKITKVTLEDAIHSSQENDMEWEYSFYDVDVTPGRSRIDFESATNEVIKDLQVRVVRENNDVTNLTETRFEGTRLVTVFYPSEWDHSETPTKTAFIISWKYARSGKAERKVVEPFI